MTISRRSFLLGGTAAAAWSLAACGSGSSSHSATGTTRPTPPTTTKVRQVGQRPDPTRPEGTDLIPQIEHIVVLMMENHSYDNYFGQLGRGDGFELDKAGKPVATHPNADVSGAEVPLFHMANTCQPKGLPSQQWNDMITQWDNGKMDGFVRSLSGPTAMGYWHGDDLPFYYGLATTFPVADRWFASCFGQTYPNRRYLLSGTSMGTIHTQPEPDATTLVPTNGTIFDALDKHAITWKDYYQSAPSLGLYLPDLARNVDKIAKIDQFYLDAQAGQLPAVSLLEPDFDRQSEEDPQDITVGEAFSARIVHAMMSSPNWAKTVFIWIYDEHGGYYDHVPPPVAVAPDDIAPRYLPGDQPFTFARYGFRVPAAIVSPYARKHYVSHVVHDHTSVLSLVEHKYNLPALTRRDGAADSLLDSLDLEADPAFLHPPSLPAPKNPNPSDPIATALCTAPGPIPNPAG